MMQNKAEGNTMCPRWIFSVMEDGDNLVRWFTRGDLLMWNFLLGRWISSFR